MGRPAVRVVEVFDERLSARGPRGGSVQATPDHLVSTWMTSASTCSRVSFCEELALGDAGVRFGGGAVLGICLALLKPS